MTEPVLLTRSEPPLGWLVFNRPDKLNALNLETWEAIPRALKELEEDDRVRVILIEGADERAFAAGADISEFEENRKDPRTAAHYAETNERAFAALRACTKPTIAVIRGYCVGGGCAIALNIDIRIAASDAKFAITPGRLGLGYAFSGVRRAVEELGPAAARYFFLTASQVTAQKALELGLLQEFHEPDALKAAAEQLGRTIAANAPKTLRAIKKSILEAVVDPSERDEKAVESLIADCFESEDYREGLRAFAEKRKPNFRDA
jgi:enoyl-CoA hydratase/carnithine racemase